ncbi:MAG: hypothetical protein FJ008_04070 [Chloroflexi bacterium]|nr:hypothetical protein [Chloroflexota bacterium]MBM3154490.1 hypothetical protein [Chloroflexota bacterium]MBM3172280.1 hypothetical protein [Chloroflexota bacterium]MBM3174752.1 hypothetical protein [Chloroflexota bacterium]MBM4449843.1 hypothetical protein [Chloroflexota bacterium]
MVINCLRNGMADHELFHFLGNRHNNTTGLHVEEDTHVIVLKDKDKVVAKWSANGVTAEEILDVATQYIKDSHYGLERRLVRFWQQHPRAKFSLEAIAGAIDTTRTNLKERIKLLAERRIIEEHRNRGSSTLYSLHYSDQAREYFAKLGELQSWDTWIQPQQFQEEATPA